MIHGTLKHSWKLQKAFKDIFVGSIKMSRTTGTNLKMFYNKTVFFFSQVYFILFPSGIAQSA